MTTELAQFIQKNKDFINEGNMRATYMVCPALLRSELTDALITAGINCTKGMSVIPSSFAKSLKIPSFIVPQGVVRIDNYGFKGSHLLDIELPDTLQYLGSEVFSFCEYLKDIRIPDSVTEIEDSCFMGCTNLEKIILSKRLLFISPSMFTQCSSLRDLTIPSSVVQINTAPFSKCYNLTKLNYEGTVEEWDNIEKSDTWNLHSSISRIICTNGQKLIE